MLLPAPAPVVYALQSSIDLPAITEGAFTFDDPAVLARASAEPHAKEEPDSEPGHNQGCEAKAHLQLHARTASPH